MKELTAEYQADKLEFIKNPVIAEFLGLEQNTSFTETELETSIISNIQKFLMEMGKGYALVARQQHLSLIHIFAVYRQPVFVNFKFFTFIFHFYSSNVKYYYILYVL